MEGFHIQLSHNGLAFFVSVDTNLTEPIWLQLSNGNYGIQSRLHDVGHILILPPQPYNGTSSWGYEGWTILQPGDKITSGITLKCAQLSLWNIVISRLKKIGLKLNVRPGIEPLLLCCTYF